VKKRRHPVAIVRVMRITRHVRSIRRPRRAVSLTRRGSPRSDPVPRPGGPGRR
jgi:hypothetical protein